MNNPVLKAISERRSIRAYKKEQITEEQLETILTSVSAAPSGKNRQPWHVTVVRNKSVVAEVNAEAQKILGLDREDIFYDAPTVIFISAEKDWAWSKVDSGILVQTMALAAQSLGLGSVILGLPIGAFEGPRTDYFNDLLKFPPNCEFAIAIAIGVPNTTKEAHKVEPDKIKYVD
ncbi:MAG: nitroreductase [Synergistaceae bacterium]|jgi:nitroreductase|nr:nitroreductase [Synergistaceae bacterium]